jgi:antitoxin component YwqK of YwqJK toxin-antitoxin module
MNLGYHKYNNDYIIEIEVINKIDDNYNIINKLYATYWTNKFKIISITNWKNDEEYEKIDIYKINETIFIDTDNDFSKLLDYHLIKELSICNYFDNKNDENIYLKNKCGVYKNYHNNGQIYKIYFHNNGIIEGEYKEYTCENILKSHRFYINGKKHGKSLFYYDNGNIWHQTNFILGVKEGAYEEYFENGNIKRKCFFVNNNFHDKYELYYDNGSIDTIGFYENGKKHGEWINYFYGGKINYLKNYTF